MGESSYTHNKQIKYHKPDVDEKMWMLEAQKKTKFYGLSRPSHMELPIDKPCSMKQKDCSTSGYVELMLCL